MQVWRIHLSGDGLSLAGKPHSLLASPLITNNEFFCIMREDVPDELVVIFGPGMNIVGVNAAATLIIKDARIQLNHRNYN